MDKQKNIYQKTGCFVLMVLLLGVFTGFYPILTPVNAQNDIIVYPVVSNSKFFKGSEVDINVTAFYYNESGSLDIKENKTLQNLTMGFGEHSIGYYDITTKKEYNLIYATIEFTIKNYTSKAKTIKYKENIDNWSKPIKSMINNNIILVNTTHFSTWSVVYNDWGYRMNISVDHTKIDTPLINFPVLVNLTSANMNFSHANISGEDIRFTDASDNPLFYEIEKYNTTENHSIIWVNITSINNVTDTAFWMYYNNTDAVDDQSVNTWNSNYLVVQHLQEETGTGAYIKDSSIPYDNGTPTGTTFSSAIIDGGRAFDGVNDWIKAGTTGSDITTEDFTIEGWFKPITFPEAYGITISKQVGDVGYQIYPRKSDGLIFVYLKDTTGGTNNYGSLVSTTYLTFDAWQHLALTGDRDGDMNIHKNGVAGTPMSMVGGADGSLTNAGNLYLGTKSEALYDYKGDMDEIRISNILRNSSWIKASYNSGYNTLLSFGEEESKTPPRVVHPNHVSFPNMQYEYVKITVNDSNYIQSEINVSYPSGYYTNYSINDDNELYIYANETGLYTYQFLVNASLGYWYNGSFTVITNFDYENYVNIITWSWENIIELIFYILVPVLFLILYESTKDKIYGLCAGVLLIMMTMRYMFFMNIMIILAFYVIVIAVMGLWKLRRRDTIV